MKILPVQTPFPHGAFTVIMGAFYVRRAHRSAEAHGKATKMERRFS